MKSLIKILVDDIFSCQVDFILVFKHMLLVYSIYLSNYFVINSLY